MPPSAGACQTTDAWLKPDWGRAGERSSIMTAMTWRSATLRVTGIPVSGAGTRVGVGIGVGVGLGLDGGHGSAEGDQDDECDGNSARHPSHRVAGRGPRRYILLIVAVGCGEPLRGVVRWKTSVRSRSDVV